MSKSFYKTLVYSLGILLASSLLLADTSTENRPNFIFVYTDDQGPWAWGLDDPDARTPNMDLIANQGARLINSLTTTPVCSPSRASLMASRYSSELGITDYIAGASEPNVGLNPEVITWPEMLSQAGYTTGLVGKWHLGTADRFHPTRHGYNYFAGFPTGGSTSLNPTVEIDGKPQVVQGWTPDVLTDLAINFVRSHQATPFLLSLHFWAPHANSAERTPDGDRTWLPLSDAEWSHFSTLDPTLPEPDYPFLDIARTKRMRREYLGSIAAVDRNLGRLLQLLDDLNLSENTVVIFSSDNGFNMGHHGTWHKGNARWLLLEGIQPTGSNPWDLNPENSPRPYDNEKYTRPYDNGKGSYTRANLWDNSLKVPTAVRWPKAIKPGTIIQQTISVMDFYPTILAMAGVSLPSGETIRGKNFLPLLKGKELDWDNNFFGQYFMDHANIRAELRCWRTPEWKLVRDFLRSGVDELYNLREDPEEKYNLIGSQDPNIRRIRHQLNRELRDKMREINDIEAVHGWPTSN